MKKRIAGVSIALSIVATLSLVGCGGSDSTPVGQQQQQQQNLTGTVATGEGAAAAISFIGAQGNTLSGHSSATGAYSIDASTLTPPIMVKATLDRDGSTLYSFVNTRSGVVNVTPLTSFIVDQAAQAAGVTGGASQLFQNYATADRSTFVTHINAETTDLDNVIASQMTDDNVSDFNHFSGEFNANHSGYDALLDNLDIVVHNDDIVIREGNTTLDTLAYDINVSEINATGSVYNATDGSSMSDVNITFQSNTDENVSVVTDSNGTFTLPIETMRTYTVTVTADGYDTQVLPNVSSFAFTQENLGSIAMFPAGIDTNTTLSGTVIDGRTSNTALSDVTITFRNGYNDRIGDIAGTVTTDTNGTYSTNLASGVYTAELTRDGYARVYRNVDVFGDTLTWSASMLAEGTDAAPGAFATVTLNWDAAPSDLDSHLTGPSAADANSSRFHMYYNHKHIYSSVGESTSSAAICADGVIASLDRDRTDDSEGLLPETTTLCSVVSGGVYKYYVHEYAGSETMSSGHATVTVTTASGVTNTFTAPTTGETGYHDIWHVFDIGADGNIYPVNEIIGNGEDTSSLLAAPSRTNSANKPFQTEKGLFDNLPTK